MFLTNLAKEIAEEAGRRRLVLEPTQDRGIPPQAKPVYSSLCNVHGEYRISTQHAPSRKGVKAATKRNLDFAALFPLLVVATTK